MRCFNPGLDGFTRVFRDFELNGALRFALNDRHPLANGRADHQIAHADPNQIAAAQLAVDREVEEREIAGIARHLKADPDRPDLLRLERSLDADDAALVPGSAARNGDWELIFGLGTSPVRPSRRHHRPDVDDRYLSMISTSALIFW